MFILAIGGDVKWLTDRQARQQPLNMAPWFRHSKPQVPLLSPDDFMLILSRVDRPLVVMAKGGLFKPNYQYLTAYKGLIFYTKSPAPLQMGKVELVSAQQIWIPG